MPENDKENTNPVNNPSQTSQGDDWKYRRPAGTWVYCQDCKRCYITGEERMIENWLWCAYDDCEYGDTYDAVEWHVIRKIYPNVPESPERDVCYIPDKLMTEEYLAERAKRGSGEKYEAVFAMVPVVEPEEYDRMD